MANEYDFGFSFSDEDAVSSTTQPKSEEALLAIEERIGSLEERVVGAVEDKYKAKLREVEGLILPLLYNLMKNPEKVYIKWENRVEIIQKQIEKITAITRS
jgi:hypothetical protein